MTESSVEKKLLYLIIFSALMHVGVFALLQYLPAGGKVPPTEPLMVDLQDIPAQLPPRESVPPVRRKADEFRRVPQETAPRGELPETPRQPGSAAQPVPARPLQPGRSAPTDLPTERSSREELFRSKERGKPADAVNLYPSAAKLAGIEERYRKKYGPEVAHGEASFLNTDDILFGSFLRRFENAVYGVWRYPADAARLGIEGVTPVKITFNRKGEVIGKELLQSSGSKILDDEVMRTLSQVGPVGSFPRGYDKETFNLIAFFHYGIIGGVQRSLR
ncbi:MAG TPA: TonB family protein [Geobacteraceae bacterium]|nr:TonB family protein [Geobacteraceae bacterium]